MSNRRLVQRSRNETASPALSRRQQPRASQTPARQSVQVELPPYETPVCAISPAAQQKLNAVAISHDYTKYKKHLKGATDTLSTSAADVNERFVLRKENHAKAGEKRRREGTEVEKPVVDASEDQYLRVMEKKITDLTKQAEAATRELIDHGDELTMQETMLAEVVESIANQPEPASQRRPEPGSEDEDDDIETPAADADNLSAVELLKKAKEDYVSTYKAKSLRSRYGQHTDYEHFKKAVHDGQTGDSGAPLPAVSTWFPEENMGARRRREHTTDNTNNGEESDDDIQIASVSQSLKCPLSMRYFEHPWSNNKCKHTVDKASFESYFKDSSAIFQTKDAQGITRPVRQTHCPQPGCDKMLRLEDYHDDLLVARQVQRAKKRERQQDFDDDEPGPRGTQRNRPEHIGSAEDDDDAVDVDEDDKKAEVARIKRERHQSRGSSTAPSMVPSQSQGRAADSDEEMEDAEEEE